MSPRRTVYKPDTTVPEVNAGPNPLVVRHSELADFRQCPLKHKLSWFGGWHDPRREQGGARELGTVWHEVLAIRYRYLQQCQENNLTPREENIEDEVGQAIESAHSEMRETLYWMYDGYVERYGWDEGLQIISVEETLTVPFHDENDKPLVLRTWDPGTEEVLWRPVLYSWTTDILAIIKEFRGLFVIDTKSTAQPLGQMDIDLSDQFGLYTVAWRRLGKRVAGQLVNQVKTKALKRPMTLDERYVRSPSIRTPRELREIELDAVGTIRAMYSVENLKRPYSAPDPRTCGWKCDFKEAHLRMRRNPPNKHDSILRAFGMQQGATHGQ